MGTHQGVYFQTTHNSRDILGKRGRRPTTVWKTHTCSCAILHTEAMTCILPRLNSNIVAVLKHGVYVRAGAFEKTCEGKRSNLSSVATSEQFIPSTQVPPATAAGPALSRSVTVSLVPSRCTFLHLCLCMARGGGCSEARLPPCVR